MNEFLEIFGSIPISKVILAAIALMFFYKILNEGYDLIIEIYEKRKTITDKNKQIEELQSQVEKIGDGVVALLHFRLYVECQRIICCGYCTLEEWEDLEHLFQTYEALGGNGTGKILYQKAKDTFRESRGKNE